MATILALQTEFQLSDDETDVLVAVVVIHVRS